MTEEHDRTTDDEQEDVVSEAASDGAPGFTKGDTPSEDDLSDPDIGGTAGGGPAGA